MTIKTPHVADTGTSLRILFLREDGSILDISAASTRDILLRKPDGSTVVLAGSFVTDGQNGLLEFITLADTFNLPGRYTIQGHVVAAGTNWHSVKDTFNVLKNVA